MYFTAHQHLVFRSHTHWGLSAFKPKVNLWAHFFPYACPYDLQYSLATLFKPADFFCSQFPESLTHPFILWSLQTARVPWHTRVCHVLLLFITLIFLISQYLSIYIFLQVFTVKNSVYFRVRQHCGLLTHILVFSINSSDIHE